MARHGSEQHFVRPDVTYITTVLQATAQGYQPVQDAMEVGSRFVAPMGLAGQRVTFHGYHRGMGAPPVGTKVQAWWAGVKARIAARRLARMSAASPIAPASVVTVDTSPRPANSDPTALAVQSGWAPGPQSPGSAASQISHPNAGDPPFAPSVVAANQIAPSMVGWPGNFWNDVIRGGLPPVVAARGENDALRLWFSGRLPPGSE
jgi:hypothetical protein